MTKKLKFLHKSKLKEFLKPVLSNPKERVGERRVLKRITMRIRLIGRCALITLMPLPLALPIQRVVGILVKNGRVSRL
jgi:hypothetical protein